MKHKFTTREMVMILICAVLALGIFYYEFAYKGIMNTISENNTEDLESELTVTQAKAARYKQMQAAIAQGSDNTSEIAVYNNLAQEVAEVGNILNNNAQDIAITWNQPVLTDTTVRRQADVSFDTNSYQNAQVLIRNIIDCRYRNVVSDVTISSNTDASLESSNDVNVSLTVTFFETINGAVSQEGLTAADDSTNQ